MATYRAGLALEAAGLAALLLRNPLAFGAMAFAAGLLVPGITAVMLSRVNAVPGLDAAARQRGWTAATVAWALGQAAAAYGLAWVYSRTGDYRPVLAVAGAAVLAAGAMEVLIARRALPLAVIASSSSGTGSG